MPSANTAGPVSDSQAMIAGMAPAMADGRYVFVTMLADDSSATLLAKAVASVREAEGLSLVLTSDDAQAAGFSGPAMRMITLAVHSDLEGVGLTAVVSGALAQAGIACNMVAGFHHDHVFVPHGDAQRALALLHKLQQNAVQA